MVPVGAAIPVRIDARIIAATNRDLASEIRRGTFRPDLYYRLDVITLMLPPLRERRNDIPLLAEHFLAGFSRRLSTGGRCRVLRLGAEAVEALRGYDWPGNVRELENVLERAAVLSPGDVIGVDVLPARIRRPSTTPFVSEAPPQNPTLELIERAYIQWVLDAEGGNRARAAQVLGIDPSTLYRKLERYDMGSGNGKSGIGSGIG